MHFTIRQLYSQEICWQPHSGQEVTMSWMVPYSGREVTISWMVLLVAVMVHAVNKASSLQDASVAWISSVHSWWFAAWFLPSPSSSLIFLSGRKKFTWWLRLPIELFNFTLKPFGTYLEWTVFYRFPKRFAKSFVQMWSTCIKNAS